MKRPRLGETPAAKPAPTPAAGPVQKAGDVTWKNFAPLLVAIIIALIPAPAGLAQHAWYFFAIFAGVIVGLMFEPLPGGAIGLIGIAIVTVLAPWVLYSPADLAKAGFNPTNAALT